jgi:Glycosyl hydrolase family 76
MRIRAVAGSPRATIWLIAVQVAAACLAVLVPVTSARSSPRPHVHSLHAHQQRSRSPRLCAHGSRSQGHRQRRKALFSPCPPGARTGAASSVTTTSAIVAGRVKPNASTSYFFSYGTTARYGSRSSSRRAGRRPKAFATSVTLASLRPYTRYHFRIIATNCGGCRTGTTYGADHTFTTAATPPPPLLPPPLPPPPPPAAPLATTGPAIAITQTSATVTGTVVTNGLPTTWHFEYGPTSAYVSETPPQSGAPGMTNVSASLTGLADAQTYHYRLVATNSLGTSYGADQTFTTQTPTSTQQENADHAVATYAAMQQYFYAPNVYPGDTSSLYVEDYPQSGNRYSYLWPFSRALVGTITLAGIPPSVDGGLEYQADVNDRLTGLSHYWDGAANPPGYDSYVTAPFGGGGDKYYDDQAWVGLALAQDYRLTRSAGALSDAESVFSFVYPGGWDGNSDEFDPGGTFWVQQGAGLGLTNHERTTTSNAPNAELGFRLEQLDPGDQATYETGSMMMYGWVNHYLYNVESNPTDPNAPNPNYEPSKPALVFDKVTEGRVGKTLWTYNQGAMIAANVTAYQDTDETDYLMNAEALANASLDYFTEADYLDTQPAAFVAIYFRGLLVLYAATGDSTLRAKILRAAQTYADDAWNNYRNGQNLFHLPSSPGSSYRLLDQGALLELYAALAWEPSDYDMLP